MIMRVPIAIFWRRKDILALGITQWALRRALERRRLFGVRLPWRTYCLYRRDKVMKAFKLRPCDGAGQPEAKSTCEFVEMN